MVTSVSQVIQTKLFKLLRKMKIGVIGAGFVGSAIINAHDQDTLVIRDPAKGFNTPLSDFYDCDAIFVSVPSPQTQSGECDTSILEEVIDSLSFYNYGPIISKVTAPPSVYTKLQAKSINLVFAPEFLVAAKANMDYLYGKFSMIGGKSFTCVEKAEQVIRRGQRFLQDVAYCTIEEAALAKYTINSFLSLKVAYLNQIYELANSLEINYNNVKDLIKLDATRLGNSHFDVPGPDTYFGFGGACFPKDTAALLFESQKHESELSILKEAIVYNKLLRDDPL